MLKVEDIRCFNLSDPHSGVCKRCKQRAVDIEQLPALPVGLKLYNNRYRLGCTLGQGGFGITYIGFDDTLNVLVAIKEYFPQGFVSRSELKLIVNKKGQKLYQYGLNRFLEEAQTLAQFDRDPAIVSVSDFFEENDTAYMVMRYVEGQTLHDYIVEKGGKLSYSETLELMTPIKQALTTIHKESVIHRDISPDNIYITSEGKVMLLDFGAARAALNAESQQLSVILKRGYAPIEQYKSSGQGPWTDVYAFAATIYRTITGQIPEEAVHRLTNAELPTMKSMGIRLPSHVEEGLIRGLAVHKEMRPQSVNELWELLLRPGAQGPPQTMPSPSIPITQPSPFVSNYGSDRQPVHGAPYIQQGNVASGTPYWKYALGVLVVIVGITVVMTQVSKSEEPVDGSAKETIVVDDSDKIVPVPVPIPIDDPPIEGTITSEGPDLSGNLIVEESTKEKKPEETTATKAPTTKPEPKPKEPEPDPVQEQPLTQEQIDIRKANAAWDVQDYRRAYQIYRNYPQNAEALCKMSFIYLDELVPGLRQGAVFGQRYREKSIDLGYDCR